MAKNNNPNAARSSTDRPEAQPGRTDSPPKAGTRESSGPVQHSHEDRSRWRETMSEAHGRIESMGHRASETVGEYPMISILTGFGIGFGVGYALALALTPEPEPTWTDRARRSIADAFDDLRHSLRELPHTTAERVASAFHRS